MKLLPTPTAPDVQDVLVAVQDLEGEVGVEEYHRRV